LVANRVARLTIIASGGATRAAVTGTFFWWHRFPFHFWCHSRQRGTIRKDANQLQAHLPLSSDFFAIKIFYRSESIPSVQLKTSAITEVSLTISNDFVNLPHGKQKSYHAKLFYRAAGSGEDRR
jgi:hypothetical protein